MPGPAGPAPVSCREFEALWSFTDSGEPLPGDAARHLAACARCRALAGSEPSRLFALLRGSSPEPAPAWDGFREQARAMAEARRAQELARRRAGRRWALTAACALILGATLWVLRAPLRRAGDPPGGEGLVLDTPSAPGENLAAAPTLESIASPGARVVDLKIFGDRDQVTEIILIFDEGIDL